MATPQDVLDALVKLELRLEAKIDSKIDAFRLEMNGRFDAIEVRLDRLETEYQMILVGLRRIEERLAEQGIDLQRVRSELARLHEKVSELDAKLAQMEARLSES